MTFRNLEEDSEIFLEQYQQALAAMPAEVAVILQPQQLLAVLSQLQASLAFTNREEFKACAGVVREFIDKSKQLFPAIVQHVIELDADPQWNLRFETVDPFDGIFS